MKPPIRLFIDTDGVERTITQIAKRHRMNETTLRNRLVRLKWPLAVAVAAPVISKSASASISRWKSPWSNLYGRQVKAT